MLGRLRKMEMNYEERYEVLIFSEWSKNYENVPIARASNGMVVMPIDGIEFGDIVFAKIARLAPLRYWKVVKLIAKLGTITKSEIDKEEMEKAKKRRQANTGRQGRRKITIFEAV